MTKVCDSLVKNIYKNHNINNSIINSNNNLFNNMPNKNYEIVNNEIFTIDNKNKENEFYNDIIEANNSQNENEINNSKINNNINQYINNNDLYENIKNVKQLKKLFNFGKATGDGNCLFYSLSTTTFGTDAYFNDIRTAICNYMEYNDIVDLYDLDKENYLKNMRKNGTFGGMTEIQVYSIISKLKIVCFTRTFLEINKYKANDNDSIFCFISGRDYDTEIYILLNVKEKLKGKNDEEEKNKEKSNHYIPLKKKIIIIY